MSDKSIIRGTTPTYIVEFEGSGVDVSDIKKATLMAKYRGVKTDLSDGLILDTEANTISYHFSQAETLAYRCDTNLVLQMDVVVNGERLRAREDILSIKATLKDEVI